MRGRAFVTMVDEMVYRRRRRGDAYVLRRSGLLRAPRGARSETRGGEEGRRSCVAERHVREQLADRAGELEAVSGARRCVRDRPVAVDDEMAVGAVRVQAHLRAATFAIRERHAAAQKGADPLLVLRARLAVDRVGIGAVAEVQACHLETVRGVVGETVIEAVGVLDDVD